MPIPVKMGLLDRDGNSIPILLENKKNEEKETVLLITKAEEQFVFKNVKSHPIPSLLRGFSSPVKIDFNYKENDLRILSKHDTDLFNKVDSCQQYIMNYTLELIKTYQTKKSIELKDEFIEFFSDILKNSENNPRVLSMMLNIPKESEIAEKMSTIDVEAILYVRAQMISEIATHLRSSLMTTYKKYQEEYKQEHMSNSSADARSLKNTCLDYLTKLNDPEINKIAQSQFDKSISSNMTDTYAVLMSLTHIDCNERVNALEKFYKFWENDSLVLNKWFAAQATSALPGTLENIKLLMQHPKFDIKNPNLVRALLRPFIKNFSSFHASNGEGYKFLTETILRIDPINSGVAAEFVRAYAKWSDYDQSRQILMYKQLQFILQQENISKNVYEIASKSLGDSEPAKKSKPVITELPSLTKSPTLLFIQKNSGDFESKASGALPQKLNH